MIEKKVTVELTTAEIECSEPIQIVVEVKEKETGESILYSIDYPKTSTL